MKIRAWVTLTLRDTKSGKVLSRRRFRSHSYVIAFLDILYEQFIGVAQSITDTGGTSRSVSAHANSFSSKAPASTSVWGLVVGTGTTAVALTDTKLVTQIAHGTGAGQLSHGLVEYLVPSTSGTTRKFILTRSFVNVSGSTITIQECGSYSCATATPYYFCTVRDLVSGGQAVLNGQTLALQYTISVTV